MSILGLDIGSAGTKAIAFNECGESIASSYEEYNLFYPEQGWVELNVDEMWRKIFLAIKKINNNEKVKKDPIKALAASTIGECFTPIDNKGNILYNTIYCHDTRSIKELNFILTKISAKELFYITGYPVGLNCPLNKILWFKNNLPDIYLKTKKILFTEDLLFHKLGAEQLKLSHSLCSRTLFFDINNKKWCSKILDEFDINKDLFSEPSLSGVNVGYVSKKISEELGFKNEVSIITGGWDQCCASLGVGGIKNGITVDGMGSFESINTTSTKIILNDEMFKNNYSCHPHVVDNMFLTVAYNSSSGSVIKWFRDVFTNKEINEAKEKGISIYAYLDSKLNFEPSNLYFLPYFSASGTPYFDPVAKGTIVGLNLETKSIDIYKSIIEGLIFEIDLIIKIAEKSKINISEIRAVGGGANSDYWLNLKSSILNRSIKKMEVSEAGCLAAMIIAGSCLGKFSVEEAISNFIRVKKIFYPNKKIQQKYLKNLFKYKKLYKVVSEIYK